MSTANTSAVTGSKPGQTAKTTVILFSQPPYDGQSSREAIDVMLSFAAYGQRVQPVFTGNGVFQLVKHQNPAKIGAKSPIKILSAPGLYGIEKVHIDRDSLLARGLTARDIFIDYDEVATSEISTLIHHADQVLIY
ncbi:MAG: sulfurtransferase complex subunit TusC [Proteobacteria bacterium]|nr:MAG: sulfurtransferase complex subunit TusC [Pseudomonadota bacterium]PIE40344.1 MAG: sulfurtransferase complex subunit TusC [Gammaproteobacteria bacterium]